MRILIAGAGVVGFNLARQLVGEGQDVAVLDSDAERVRRVSEKLDVLAVQGHGASLHDLRRAGLTQTELLVAVTEIDEVNMIACFLAGEQGVPRRVARVRNLQYAGTPAPVNLAALHIDRIVNPDDVLVDAVLRLVATPGAFEAADFGEGQILLRGFELLPDSPLVGRTLAEFRGLGLEGVLVVGLIRERHLQLPTGADELKAHDHVFVLATREALAKLVAMIAPGARLARRLAAVVEEVVLIEADAERAEQAANELRHATVLRGEVTDRDILREARVGAADVFVALGERDDENLLGALLAKRQGAPRTIVCASDPAYLTLFHSIGIDAVVNARLLTVGEILRELRRAQIHSVAKLQEFEAEALEIEVMAESPAAGRAIKDVTFPRGALVGAVIEGGAPRIPRGDTVLQPGSTVIVFALPTARDKVEQLFLRKRSRRTAVIPRS